MDKLRAFLESQKLLAIASFDSEPWIANVFYGVDEELRFYFVSNTQTNHGKHILQNPSIAFNTAWFNPTDHTDRKAIQGKGSCRIAKTDQEIETGIRLHNTRFPEFAEKITVDWIRDPSHSSEIWVIEPTYIKFWNDQLYGPDGVEEFHFDSAS